MTETPENETARGPAPPAQDVDPGQPIAELAAFGVTPGRHFLDRVRRKIGRRVLTADVLDFSTASPFSVFLEFLAVVFEGLGGRNRGTGGSR